MTEIISKCKIEYIIIAICTYKREKLLERLLVNLQKINYPSFKTEILVVDNDINQSAKEVCEKFKKKAKINIVYSIEENRGFSNARNKALKKSFNLGATHIAFIDDDEIADKNWLINHVDFYNKFNDIYISSAPTYKKFEQNYPDYIVNNITFKSISHKELGKLKKTAAGGNVFFPLDIVKHSNIYFDDTLNVTGSEDTDFFGRLSNAGYKIGWNNNAVNYEIVQSDRANIKWILKRAFNTGYSVAKIKKRQLSKTKSILYNVEKFITVIFEIIILPFTIIAGLTMFFNRLTVLCKNIGKLVSSR